MLCIIYGSCTFLNLRFSGLELGNNLKYFLDFYFTIKQSWFCIYLVPIRPDDEQLRKLADYLLKKFIPKQSSHKNDGLNLNLQQYRNYKPMWMLQAY